MMAVLKFKSMREPRERRRPGDKLALPCRREASGPKQKTDSVCHIFGREKRIKTALPKVILALRSACNLLMLRVMMYRLLFCAVWVMATFSFRVGATNLDHLTVGSTTYSNVTVFGASKTDLFFTSDQGVSNVKLKYLDPELQKRFNYNSNAAEKVEEQRVASDKAFQAGLAASLAARVKAVAQEREIQTRAAYSQAGLGDAVSEKSPLGHLAPPLTFTNWIGGEPSLAGKFTLVSVWSPKSLACKKWIAPLNELHRALMGKVEMIGVTAATEAEVAEADLKPDYPCAIDTGGVFISKAGVMSLPCVLLIDTNNVVRYLGHPAAVTTNSLQALLKSEE